MSNELQKDEFYLKGGIGNVYVNGVPHEITSVENKNDGATTLTIGRSIYEQYSDKTISEITEILKTEDVEFEIIEPKQIEPPKLD